LEENINAFKDTDNKYKVTDIPFSLQETHFIRVNKEFCKT